MQVNPLFTNIKEINPTNYLMKIGIDKPQEYMCATMSDNDILYSYKNIEKAWELFHKPYSHYWILQDCDADGVMSSVIMYWYLRHINIADEDITILYHNDKRHGLNEDIIAQIESLNNNGLLIIPDACPEKQEYVDRLWEDNIEILCLDHHLTEEFNYCVTVNNQHSEDVTNKALSGTGVTHKFISFCCMKEEDSFDFNLCDMVALANIADICDMRTLENRWYSAYGLDHIVNPFLKELCKVYIGENEAITPTNLAWNVIPKINAVCRSDNQELKQRMTDCFMIKCKDYGDTISDMTSAHRKQGEMTKKLMANMQVKELDKFVVAFAEQTPYTGLVANKLQDIYNKPTLVLYETENHDYCGSCRSPIDFINICNDSGLFNFAKGHEAAFGVSIDLNNLPKFNDYLAMPNITIPKKTVCAILNGKEIPDELFEMFDGYEDLWSNSIEEPVYFINNITLNGSNIQKIGRNGSTIKFTYGEVEFIKFFVSSAQKEEWKVGENLDLDIEILGKLSLNPYGGRRIPQVVIDKMEVKVHEKKNVTFEDIFG